MINEPNMSVKDKLVMLKELSYDGAELRIDQKNELKTFLKAVDQSDLPGWAPNLIGAQNICRTGLPSNIRPWVGHWNSEVEL